MKFLLACAVLILGCVTTTPSQAADSYSIAPGSTTKIDEHGVCRQVTNNAGATIFVPTRSSAEWQSFLNNFTGATKAACPVACGGTSYGGYCWYHGPTRGSCVDACASRGGGNSAGTINYVGSGGSDANCLAVIKAMWPSMSQFSGSLSANPPNMGCYVYGGDFGTPFQSGRIIRTPAGAASPTTLAAKSNSGPYDFDGLWRICACNN